MLLYLLARESNSLEDSVELDAAFWRLITQDLDSSETRDLQFTCISYSWGAGREPNPFEPTSTISSRTIPALLAAATHRPSSTCFWVDAFCMPQDTREKTETLEGMGYIYSEAHEVIAVLSSSFRPALEQMRISDRVDPRYLHGLESDEWVSRAWTYQEAVNSKALYVTCEEDRSSPNNDSSPLIDGAHFMNCLGYTLSLLEGTGFDKMLCFPRLDAFTELIADYMSGGYQQRPALQVMSNMDRRTQSRAEDHFYAMLGAISIARPSFIEAREPCELFMSLCEGKGDYSFIYSAAKRDEMPSRRWRPAARLTDLPSILPWYCYGEGQAGYEREGSFYLDQVMLLEQAPIEEGGEKFVEEWLGHSKILPTSETSQVPLWDSAYTALRIMGFKGSPECLSTKSGFFFPFEQVSTDQVVSIVVATGVKWTLGAPGLARYYQGNEESYMPGVFFGRIDKLTATSVRVS